MPPKHLNVILLAMSISLLCYMVHRRARTAMMVGNAVELINAYYVDPVERDDLLTGAMNGLTDKLDQHSSFIPASAYKSFQDSIDQEFAGIGIIVDQPEAGGPVRVVTPLVGSPALSAGMLPDDQIIQVDGVDVSTQPLSKVSKALKGPIDTEVDIVVRRDEDEEVNLSVCRATIALESVVGSFRDESDNWVYRLAAEPSIAYMRMTTFGEKTVQELKGEIENLGDDYEALILDLRGNSGGLLYAARDVSDMFLPKDSPIVSTRLRGGKIDEQYYASADTVVPADKQVVVMIDENSASASEIVAACLQDNKRAAVVGVRSYGKGTVQNILPLQFGRSALRLTVARYYRPNGENIHRVNDATEEDDWGVMPDEGLAVDVDEETQIAIFEGWQAASYPMLATEKDDDQEGKTAESAKGPLDVDPQLRRAVDHLLEKLGKKPQAENDEADQASEETEKVAA